MTINFKLSPRTELDATLDDMNRTWCGVVHGASDQAVHDQNRGIWPLGPRADRERYATYSTEGETVIGVEIERIETIPSKDPDRRSKRAIVGRVLTPSDPMWEKLVGQPVPAHRNPVSYVPDPDSGDRTCACGCGAPVAGRRVFQPGHDQRAVHDRITRRWGSTLKFIDWFDAAYEPEPMVPVEALARLNRLAKHPDLLHRVSDFSQDASVG